MARFLCFTLLFLIALPGLAQDEPLPTLGQALPRDPAFLMRMREQISQKLQHIQQALTVVNPNDTQLIESLAAQQADLIKQHADVLKELQAIGTGNQGMGSVLSGTGSRSGTIAMPPGTPGTSPPVALQQAQLLPPEILQSLQTQMHTRPVPDSFPPGFPPGAGVPINPMMGNPPYPPLNNGMPMQGMSGVPMPNDGMGVMPTWGNPQATWDAPYWGPRLPKELTEVKQSVESLQREIGGLRETIKNLETQIQLLNHTVLLLSERLSGQTSERVRGNEE